MEPVQLVSHPLVLRLCVSQFLLDLIDEVLAVLKHLFAGFLIVLEHDHLSLVLALLLEQILDFIAQLLLVSRPVEALVVSLGNFEVVLHLDLLAIVDDELCPDIIGLVSQPFHRGRLLEVQLALDVCELVRLGRGTGRTGRQTTLNYSELPDSLLCALILSLELVHLVLKVVLDANHVHDTILAHP